MALRAVTDPTRRRILESFHRRPMRDLTVDEVAGEQLIHRTVAFDHLELLAGLGLLSTGARRTGWRGKPARTYRLAGGAVEVSVPKRQYRLLSVVLADGVADLGPAALEVVRERARQSAADLVERAPAGSDPIDILCLLGGDFVLTETSVRSRNCIFKEACAEARSPVACAVQAGLIEGALSASSNRFRAVPAGPDESGGCVFRIVEAS
jgi:predicted ArsR family transcriptional regulator